MTSCSQWYQTWSEWISRSTTPLGFIELLRRKVDLLCRANCRLFSKIRLYSLKELLPWLYDNLLSCNAHIIRNISISLVAMHSCQHEWRPCSSQAFKYQSFIALQTISIPFCAVIDICPISCLSAVCNEYRPPTCSPEILVYVPAVCCWRHAPQNAF